MGDTYESVSASFEVRKVPDVLTKEQLDKPNPPEQGAGFYEFGAVVGGVFVPIAVRKAAGLDADIERLQKSQPQSEPTEPSE